MAVSLWMAVATAGAARASGGGPEVLAEFVRVGYSSWPSSMTATQVAFDAGGYVNASITGVKWFGGRTYLTVPRWRPGIPATLTVLSTDSKSLEAWPSWAMNEIGDCDALQYVQSMEVDPSTGVMWVIDVGRRNILDPQPDNSCPPKMVLVDIATAAVVSRHTAPDAVAAYDASFFNDVVIDPGRGVAYISDLGTASVVVFTLSSQTWRRFSVPEMQPVPGFSFTMAGAPFSQASAVDGIALDPSFETLYFCPMSSLSLYSASAASLRNTAGPEAEWFAAAAATVVGLGKRVAPMDGMAFDNAGTLFFGGLNTSSVYRWAPGARDTVVNAAVVADSPSALQWVDTFAFSDEGLVFTTNKLAKYFDCTMDFSGRSGPNFRVMLIQDGARSYTLGAAHHGGGGGTKLSATEDVEIGVSVVAAVLVALVVWCYVRRARELKKRDATDELGRQRGEDRLADLLLVD